MPAELDPPAMTQHLAAALARGLPGHAAQREMAHGLAYGRHRGPVPDDAIRAAVLVALHPSAAGWSIPAILRPATMRSHADQVSLPGGMIELDESPTQAALREFEEELGVSGSEFVVIGELTPLYVFVSGFAVTPVLAVSLHALEFRPNPDEVAALLELSLAALTDASCRGHHLIQRRGLTFSVPHLLIDGRPIWGATSLILAEFLELLSGADIPVCRNS